MPVKISFQFKYIDIKKVTKHALRDRPAVIDQYFQRMNRKFLKLDLPGQYKRIGTKKRPRGFEATVPAATARKIKALNYIDLFTDYSRHKKKAAPKPEFFCIKMTVAIQIEGLTKGLQTYEERFVLIKANSPEEAYKKVRKQAPHYEMTYLNANGGQVRWKIESYDDWYRTDINKPSQLDDPQGIEVFSVLKKRKLTKDRIWRDKS